jgi:hypothetical protein
MEINRVRIPDDHIQRERGIPDKATMSVVERPLAWNLEIRMLREEAPRRQVPSIIGIKKAGCLGVSSSKFNIPARTSKLKNI